MAILSRDEFYQQYDAAKQQGMSGGQAINYLAQAAVAAQPKNNQTSSSTYSQNKTWQPDSLVRRDQFNAQYGTSPNSYGQNQQSIYNADAALRNLQNIAATTTDKQLAKTITKYTSGDAKKDNFWGQTSASFGSGKINELLNQAWGKYAEDGSAESKAVADAYAQLAEYYQNVNAEALDDENRKAKWLSQDMAQYLPQFMEQTKASAAPILGGAAAGAVIGELVTPIPGADALIGALAGGVKGAMGGTVAGTKVGGLIGAGKYSYNTMRGASMKSLIEAGATTEQAQEASRDEAIISTAIENLDNAADLFLLIPGMGGMGKAAAKTALGKFAEWAGNVAQEGGEEFIQELISIANERRVKNGTTGDGALGLAKEVMALGQEIAKDAKNSDELKQALEAARGGAVIGGFMGPTGAAVNKVITGPMQNTALNAINDIAPNQEVAQQNRNFIAESNANSRASAAVNDYIRGTNRMSNEEADTRRNAYSEYSDALDGANRGDILIDKNGNKVGEVKGIAGNGFTVDFESGAKPEAIFRSGTSGSLDTNVKGGVYDTLKNGGEIVTAQEYETRRTEAEAKAKLEAEEAERKANMQPEQPPKAYPARTVSDNPQQMATQEETAPAAEMTAEDREEAARVLGFAEEESQPDKVAPQPEIKREPQQENQPTQTSSGDPGDDFFKQNPRKRVYSTTYGGMSIAFSKRSDGKYDVKIATNGKKANTVIGQANSVAEGRQLVSAYYAEQSKAQETPSESLQSAPAKEDNSTSEKPQESKQTQSRELNSKQETTPKQEEEKKTYTPTKRELDQRKANSGEMSAEDEAQRERELEHYRAEEEGLKEKAVLNDTQLKSVLSSTSSDADFSADPVTSRSEALTSEEVAKLTPMEVIQRLAMRAKQFKLGGLFGIANRFADVATNSEGEITRSSLNQQYIEEAVAEEGEGNENSREGQSEAAMQAVEYELRAGHADDLAISIIDAITIADNPDARIKALDDKITTVIEHIFGDSIPEDQKATAISQTISFFEKEAGIDIDPDTDTARTVLKKIRDKYPKLFTRAGDLKSNDSVSLSEMFGEKMSDDVVAEMNALFDRAKGIDVTTDYTDARGYSVNRQLSDILEGFKRDTDSDRKTGLSQYFDNADIDTDNSDSRDNAINDFKTERERQGYEDSWFAKNKKKLSESEWRERVFSEFSLLHPYVYERDADGNILRDENGNAIRHDTRSTENVTWSGEKGNKEFVHLMRGKDGQQFILKLAEGRFGNILSSNIGEKLRSIHDAHQAALNDAKAKLDNEAIEKEQAFLDKFENANYNSEDGSYTLKALFEEGILSEEERRLFKDNDVREFGTMSVKSLMNSVTKDAMMELIYDTINKEANGGQQALRPSEEGQGRFLAGSEWQRRSADKARGIATADESGRVEEAQASGEASPVDNGRPESSLGSEAETGAAGGRTGGEQRSSVYAGNSGTEERNAEVGSATRSSGAQEGWETRKLKRYKNAEEAKAGHDEIHASNLKVASDIDNAIAGASNAKTKLGKQKAIRTSLEASGYTVIQQGTGKAFQAVVHKTAISVEEAAKSDSRFKRVVKRIERYGAKVSIVEGLAVYDDSYVATPVRGLFTVSNGDFTIQATDYDSLVHELNHAMCYMAREVLFPRAGAEGMAVSQQSEKFVNFLGGEIRKAFIDAKEEKLLNSIIRGADKDKLPAEEFFVEALASTMSTRYSAWENFDEIGELMRDSKVFQNLAKTIENASDGKLNSWFLNREAESRKMADTAEGYSDSDIEAGDSVPLEMRMEDWSKGEISAAEWNEILGTLEDMSQDNDTSVERWPSPPPHMDEDTFESNWNEQHAADENGEVKHTNPFMVEKEGEGKGYFGNMGESRGSIEKFSEKLSRLRNRDKAFNGSRTAVQMNALTSMMQKVYDGDKSATEMYHMLQNFRGVDGIGAIVDDYAIGLFKRLAYAEQAAYDSSGNLSDGRFAKMYRSAADKAFNYLAAQAELASKTTYGDKITFKGLAEKYGKGKAGNILKDAAQWLNRMQINGGNFWRMLGGYDKGSNNLGYVYKNKHERAIHNQINDKAQCLSYFEDAKKAKDYTEFANGSAKGTYGTLLQEVSLYKDLKRLYRERTVKDDSGKTKKLPDWSRVYRRGNLVLEDEKGNVTSTIAIEGKSNKEREKFIQNLYRTLEKDINGSEAAKAYITGIESTMKFMSPKLYNTSRKLGFDRVMEDTDKYFPLENANKPDSANPYVWELEADMGVGIAGFKNMKSRYSDDYDLRIRPASVVVDQYIQQATNYAAFAEFGAELKMLINPLADGDNLGDIVANNFGETYGQWLKNYTKDINQISTEDPTGLNKYLSKARNMVQQGALLGSLSVPIKQISSYFSAMGVIDPRAVMKAYRPTRRSGNKIYDFIYKSRTQGSVDPDVSQALSTGWVDKLRKSGKLGAAVVNATNTMDSRTVANVYYACCLDVEMNSGLSMDEIYKNGKNLDDGLTNAGELLVHAKFSEAVLNTQPVFNRQARAEIARTSNEALRMLSVFRTQQTQNYNRLLTTINEAIAAKKFDGNTKSANTELRQTIGGQVAAAASISALTIIADMVLHKHKKYKDDDDEFDEKKVMERFALNFAEAGAGTALFAGDVTKWLIDQVKGNTGDYASNKEFYGISMGAISSLKSAVNAWTWLYSDMLKGGKHAASDLRYAVNYTATLLGIPAQNAYNLMNMFYQHISDMIGKDMISGYSSGKYEDIMKEWDAIRTDYGNKLYSAVRAGNTAKAKESVEQMGDKFLSMIKTSSMEQLKSGDADDDEVLNVLMTYGNRTAEEAADDLYKMHLQIDTGYTSLTGTGKQTAETAYKDGEISRAEFKKLVTKYSGKTADEAEGTISRIDFKAAYPKHSYTDLNKMVLNSEISDSEALKWYKKTQDKTDEQADNWLERLQFQRLTGYEANWRSTSDLYDTYSSKEKMGLMSFYNQYGKQFRSPKEFGRIFNELNNVDRANWPTYHNSNGYDASANQARVITQMNSLIRSGSLTYDMAKTIWDKVYGWSTKSNSAWGHVKG